MLKSLLTICVLFLAINLGKSQNLTSMSLTDDATDLTITILGPGITASYNAFIDIDNNGDTGYDGGSTDGADFYFSGGLLYPYTGTGQAWGWGTASAISVTNASGSREFEIPKTSLGLIAAGTTINVIYQSVEAPDVLPEVGMQSYVTTSAYVPNLSSMTLSDDATDLTIVIQGSNIIPAYDAFIDIDNDGDTGYDGGSIDGADFYLSGGLLYPYTGTGQAWGWGTSSSVSVTNGSGSRTFEISKTILGLASAGTTINMIYQSTGTPDVLPTMGMQSYVTSSAYVPNLSSMTLSDDATDLTILIQGSNIITAYDAFVDIDNDGDTGYDGGSIDGADFYLSGGLLYPYTGAGQAWGWGTPSSVSVTDGSGSRTFEISKTILGLTSAGTTINMIYQSTGTADVLPTMGMQSYVTTSAYLPNLATMTLTDNSTDLTILIEGSEIIAAYDAFIDIDNDGSTGYDGGSVDGADFYISGGLIYPYTGTGQAWGWGASSAVVVTDGSSSARGFLATVSREISISKATLGLSMAGTSINVIYQSTGTPDVLPEAGMQSYVTTSSAIVPVELVRFTGKAIEDGNVLLEWSTGSEIDNDLFEIETSQNGLDFYQIGKVKGEGNSTSNIDYSFLDRNASVGINYYRLKQIDLNGEFEFSNIVSTKGMKRSIKITPNPANDYVSISLPSKGSQGFEIYDLKGGRVLAGSAGLDRIDISSLSPGIYIFRSGYFAQKLIKN